MKRNNEKLCKKLNRPETCDERRPRLDARRIRQRSYVSDVLYISASDWPALRREMNTPITVPQPNGIDVTVKRRWPAAPIFVLNREAAHQGNRECTRRVARLSANALECTDA